MRIILSAIFLLAMPCFIGCRGQSLYWYNPDRTLKQAKMDCRECYRQAQVEAIERAIIYKHKYQYSGGPGRVYGNVQFNRCMKKDGYHRVPEDQLNSTVKKRFFGVSDDSAYSIAGN